MIHKLHLQRLLTAPGSALVLACARAAAQTEMPDIRDIRGPVPLTFWEAHGTTVIVSSVVGSLLLALIAWLVLRRPPQPPPTPVERARRELDDARALLVTGQDKPFAILVSDTVRRYLEGAYHLPAPERTTEEFLQQITRHDRLRGELAGLLGRFLEWCDLAKFAGRQFGPNEREQLLDSARQFVERADELLRAPQPVASPPPLPRQLPPAVPPPLPPGYASTQA